MPKYRLGLLLVVDARALPPVAPCSIVGEDVAVLCFASTYYSYQRRRGSRMMHGSHIYKHK